ncbi:MAG: S8 family serine peptidase [Pseudomonadota bacterium]
MNSTPYIVLRSTGERPPNGLQSGQVRDSEPVCQSRHQGLGARDGQLELSILELTERDRREMRNDPQIMALAQPMPVRLVSPVAEQRFNSGLLNPVTLTDSLVRTGQGQCSGAGVKVAFLDTGIDVTHPVFDGVQFEKRNFTRETCNDIDGHGTHIASVTLGRGYESIPTGVAPGVSDVMSAKVLTGRHGRSSHVADALLWAIRGGADVITLSLDLDLGSWITQLRDRHDLSEEAAMAVGLREHGANLELFNCIARAAAGRADNRRAPTFVTASGHQESGDDISLPALAVGEALGALAVGALTAEPGGPTLADYCRYTADVLAPGTALCAAAPDSGAALMSGTSVAAAYTAGVVARWTEYLATAGVSPSAPARDAVCDTAYPLHFQSEREAGRVRYGVVRSP